MLTKAGKIDRSEGIPGPLKKVLQAFFFRSSPDPPLPRFPLFFSSLGPTFPSPSLSDSLEEAIETVEQRGERNDIDSGALEICLVMTENMFNIELICFSFQFFHVNIGYKCDRKV